MDFCRRPLSVLVGAVVLAMLMADQTVALPGAPAVPGKVPDFAANVYGPPQSLHLHVIPPKKAVGAAFVAPAPAARFAAAPAPAAYAPAVPAGAHGPAQFTAYNSLAKGAAHH